MSDIKRVTDIRRKPLTKPAPAIEMHRNGFFGRRVRKLSNLVSLKEKKK